MTTLGAGAISGGLYFIRSMAAKLAPDTSALFVLVRKAQPEKVLKELSGFRGTVLRTSLSPEQESRLQRTLSDAVATTPA